MAEVECFFDCSSPWTYFAFESLLRMQAEIGVTIEWRPFLVGGVFNAVNPSVYNSRDKPVPAKEAYAKKDQQDWARHLGLPILYRPSVFPVNSVKAMRACIVLEPDGKLVPFARAAFKAYWIDDKDISQVPVLTELCAGLGIDASALLAAIEQQPIKDKLRANTQEAINRGAFGSPTMFVGGGDMYFGNDRMPLIRDAVLRQRGG
ncbi:MAG TPA: 2-hydroxychromene-2-carboxylate isomerase [Rhodopila sp.]|uniref:2-hydroxychromene-2-carboxylate isomerase n=1 Tax=Rhodopila sp. TaxID=2480087 RepID=UPI002C7873AD|nr:2-hydroxychromene-2-carboxylate isomerase [Rhodopila sp.]HVY13753.1 2-hydroxychromene-2-carboxylate isomerase [Rhodopila sp.]